MKCVYCNAEEDQIIRNDFTAVRIDTPKYITVPCAEYFCLKCQRYFYWSKNEGIKRIREPNRLVAPDLFGDD